VRLCARWDRAGIDKENIPIIVEAVDHPDVIGMLVEETRSHWQHKGGVIFTARSDDPQLIAAATEARDAAMNSLDSSKRRRRRMTCEQQSKKCAVFSSPAFLPES